MGIIQKEMMKKMTSLIEQLNQLNQDLAATKEEDILTRMHIMDEVKRVTEKSDDLRRFWELMKDNK